MPFTNLLNFGSQYLYPYSLKLEKISGLIIFIKLNKSLGFDKAGVPVNKITCKHYLNIGTQT